MALVNICLWKHDISIIGNEYTEYEKLFSLSVNDFLNINFRKEPSNFQPIVYFFVTLLTLTYLHAKYFPYESGL
jgi:hypothetical protein